jgi:hypothetical protein
VRLRLTLLDPTSGRATDLRVEARHGARLNDLLDVLDLRDVAGPAGTDRPPDSTDLAVEDGTAD